MSPESLTTKAIKTTAIQTNKMVTKIDAYFISLYIQTYSFCTIISNMVKNVHLAVQIYKKLASKPDNMVGVRGLEPPTSRSQTARASQLRHTPIV